MQSLLIVSLAMAILAVVFALQNNSPTALSFLSWTFQSSLAVVILVAVAVGVFASFLAALPGMIRLKWQLRSCRNRVAQLEAAADRTAAPGGGAGKDFDRGPEAGLGP